MRCRAAGVVILLLGVTACGGTAKPTATIVVDQPIALVDEAVHIRVTGLPPAAPVTIEATARDYEGATWRSHGTWTADPSGAVDLDRTAPTGGTYTGVDGMGLFWSMEPPIGPADATSFLTDWPSRTPTYAVRLAVRDGKRELGHRDVVRQWRPASVTVRSLEMEKDQLVGVQFTGSKTKAPVLILTGSDGGMDLYSAALLASRGHTTLALQYFSGPGMPESLHDVPLEYFARAARLLATDRPSGIVVLGSSRGSEAALLLAQNYPDLISGTVLCAPSDVVNPSFPDPAGAAWTLNGQAIPKGPIPVDKVDGPVLAFAGDADGVWPAETQARRIMSSLDAAKVSAPHEIVVGHAAGHGVGTYPYLPSAVTATHPVTQQPEKLGGTRAGNQAARREGWPKLLALLDSV